MRAIIYVFVFVAGGLSLATVATSDALIGKAECSSELAGEVKVFH